jgi:hypothetical protein
MVKKVAKLMAKIYKIPKSNILIVRIGTTNYELHGNMMYSSENTNLPKNAEHLASYAVKGKSMTEAMNVLWKWVK